jgi:hypothetical protein
LIIIYQQLHLPEASGLNGSAEILHWHCWLEASELIVSLTFALASSVFLISLKFVVFCWTADDG